ncbi:MAG: hypothetical protein AAFR23_05030 [Pseudomonadota bacterium]
MPSTNTVKRRELAPLIVPSQSANAAPSRTRDLDIGRPPTGPRSPNFQDRPRTAANDRSGDVGPTRPAVRTQGPKAATGNIWGDLRPGALAELLKGAPVQFASPTLRALFMTVLQSAPFSDPDLSATQPKLAALRAAGLYDRGLIEQPPSSGSAPATPTGDPSLAALNAMLSARADLAGGHWQEACPRVRTQLSAPGGISKPIMAQLLMLGGVCAAFAEKPGGASLAARLARDAGFDRDVTLSLLEAVDRPAGARDVSLQGKSLDGIDVRLIQLAKLDVPPSAIADLEPSGLAALSDARTDEALSRILAAERGARANIITVSALGEAYRSADSLRRADPQLPATERAALFVEIERTQAFLQRTRLIRNLLDLAAKDGLYLQAAMLVSDATASLPKIPEIGWFAETAVEVLTAGGRPDEARAWADLADREADRRRSRFDHWRALIAISDANSGRDAERYLGAVERLAIAKRFKPEHLHVIATTLDALDYQVPFGLWEAANATPQPRSGHLPPTGTLRRLADAAKAKTVGATIMLTMTTLGPSRPADANILALGDAIRALKRSGQRDAARRLAFEALFAIWPRNGPR